MEELLTTTNSHIELYTDDETDKQQEADTNSEHEPHSSSVDEYEIGNPSSPAH